MSEGVLDDATLGRVEEVLLSACGVTLARSLRRSLEAALGRAARSRGLEPEAFLRKLLVREAAAVECFIEHAVIGETYFFRHPEHLRAVARLGRAHPAPCFQVWSAGCASGEEPYSIAMALLAEGLPEGRFRVLATDVSGRAIERAREGVYGPWSLRRIEPELEKRFLVANGEGFSVIPQVRRAVEFRRHNLVVDPPPFMGLGAIFCRNVLIYFPTELAREVLRRFIDALAPGGLLFVSPAEVPLTNGLGLETVDAEGSVALRVPVPGAARAVTPEARLPRVGGRRDALAAGALVDSLARGAPAPSWRAALALGEAASGPARVDARTPGTAADHAADVGPVRVAAVDLQRAVLAVSPELTDTRGGEGRPFSGPEAEAQRLAWAGSASAGASAPASATPAATRWRAPVPDRSPQAAPLLASPGGVPTPEEAPALARAISAARSGRFDEAEALARQAAKALVPEAYLLLSMVADVRGDLNGAVEAVRKALYLEPRLALGHATLVALYGRMERREDAERARQNALRALDGLDDEHPLRGVETMTAGGLRQALAPAEQAGWQGAR
ncbi:CheR family methyltransferase [Corallococcus macrosporus]|uniref:Chemotaxis protein methyltransferase CheR n=1 Tax=Myxococcus fulvus (strain ATCC BAA-855 / HW-1) TaxID=483219 RepID=F8CEQ0_MYXFH|nr:protein-glutamate O-methyltransferase CheR [Corallococcus macrosporus]AEI66121.1 chemotaxis protein methyltransferase CheR [Corallococcus macrosporus]